MKVGFRNLDLLYFFNKEDSLKRNILLFDKILYNSNQFDLIEKLISVLPDGKEIFKRKMFEIEKLQEVGLIERFNINSFKVPKDFIGKTDLKELIDNGLKSINEFEKLGEAKNDTDFRNQYIKLVETEYYCGYYESRLLSMVANINDMNNEYIPIITYLPNIPNNNSKQVVLSLILRKFPIISEQTEISKIIEFKSDKEVKSRYFELIDFVTSLSKTELSVKEIEDKIEYLFFKYQENLDLHKLKYTTSVLETICVTSAQIIENIVRFKFSEVIKSIFDIGKGEIEKLESEKVLEGRELSYLVKIEQQFK